MQKIFLDFLDILDQTELPPEKPGGGGAGGGGEARRDKSDCLLTLLSNLTKL